MAEITIRNTAGISDFLEMGTTGDDNVTYTGSILTTSTDANAGNGGMDTAILGADSLTDTIAGNYAFDGLTYDPTTGWAFGANAPAADTFDNSFVSITTADGSVLVGGTASSGLANGPVAGTADVDGSYSADPLEGVSFSWTGTALSVNGLATNYKVVSVDGQSVVTGSSFFASDASGSFAIVDADEDFSGTSDIEFTPNTASLAGDYNIGDTVDFTFPVVLENALGAQVTVEQTFRVTVDWTSGDDMAMGTDGADAITDGGNIVTDGTTTFTSVSTQDLGNDIIDGGLGEDTITGGAGSDTLLGGYGDDTINGADGAAANDVQMTYLGGGAGNDSLTSNSAAEDAFTLFGAGGSDTIIGGAGDDSLNGGGGNDTITAGAGDTVIRGGDGDDLITGGAGDDELRGGDGADTINSGAGNDIVYTSKGTGDVINLSAGVGLDTIVFKNGTGTTSVTGFDEDLGDSIDVSDLGYSTFAEVLANAYQTDVDGTGTDATVILGADSALVLNGVLLADLVDANFDYA